MNTRRITWIGVLVSQALVLHTVERMLPIPQLAPGVKLGLANIITLVALNILPWADAFLVMVLRSLLGALLGGGASSVLFSLAGGTLSFLAMSFLMKYKDVLFSIAAISVGGAFLHNVGQILMASLIVETFNIFVYFPILAASALVTGFFTGVISDLIINAISQARLLPGAARRRGPEPSS
ncbi:MAG: Gx transporter family protein [Firmicutes bacterium]|nr:Gx transporter family protein [Bacillota bacterium]